MYRAFIRKGHGYEGGSRGRCTAFDGFDIIAAPLHQEGEGWSAAFGDKARESRVFRMANGDGCDYGSHAIKLARETGRKRGLFILIHHGGGREVLEVPQFYDGGELEAHILAMPERLQYALLHTIYNTANNAREEARAEVRQEWAQAFVEKRIKKRRKAGRVRVDIIPQWEIDLKAEKASAEIGSE